MRHMFRSVMMIAAVALIAGCAGSDRGLRDFGAAGAGPDEFGVMPVGPLSMPANLTNLPPPTPGGTNLTDPAPLADAVSALGGNPNALVPAGSPASDNALILAASRNGVDPQIRNLLAEEDAAFRARQGRLGFFRGGDRYFQAYARQALDAYAEFIRFRNSGVAVPSAPPAQ